MSRAHRLSCQQPHGTTLGQELLQRLGPGTLPGLPPKLLRFHWRRWVSEHDHPNHCRRLGFLLHKIQQIQNRGGRPRRSCLTPLEQACWGLASTGERKQQFRYPSTQQMCQKLDRLSRHHHLQASSFRLQFTARVAKCIC